jgi:hypothetical protein
LDSISPSFTYQTSSIVWTTDYLFSWWEGEWWWYHISYSGFNVRPNKSVTVYLTVKLSETFNTDEISNCAVDSNGEISCVTIPIIIPDVQKYQKIWNNTGLHNGWTTDILEVEPLQYISYRVDFGNHWNTWAYGTVKDILPQCVQYQWSSLVGVSWTPVYDASSHTVQASNIYLWPWVTGHLMVVWKILTGGDCNDVYSYLNTWAFKFDDDSDWEYSIVEAERPKGSTDVSIQKDVDMYYVKSWDVVTYTITYKNEWSTVLVNYDIVDRWPNSQLQFSGVVTPLTPAADTSNIANNIIRWEFRNQTFNPWETRVIKIQWIVR